MQEKLQRKNGKDSLILIADDVPKNVQLLGKILDNRGYRIAAVTSGDQVVRAARKYEPDLVLLDIMMPEKSGFEVCKELKDDQILAEIPVIFLTARSEEEDIIKGLNIGGADYITKPFNSGELLARIETHLSLKEARDHVKQQREELQRLTETRDKLYSIIAHDLNNALFGISGVAEMVQEDLEEIQVEEEIKDSISLITKSANSATFILQNLLSWARFQTDELELNPESFSITEVISESISLYQTQADKKKVNIHLNDDPGNTVVFADKQMVATVIRNLISNAIKFSNNNDQITIRVTEDEKVLQVSVEDQGVGMREEVREAIFDPGERPKTVGTHNEKGTGLGLMLSKEFVEAHDGDINVESELDKGSTFSFTIPRELVTQNDQPAG